MSINRQEIIGNVGSKTELRYTASGLAVLELSIATHYKPKDGDEITTWHRCVLMGKRAEFADKHTKTGTKVFAAGRTDHRRFEGKWHTSVQIWEFEILSPIDWPEDTSAEARNPSAPGNDPEPDIPF